MPRHGDFLDLIGEGVDDAFSRSRQTQAQEVDLLQTIQRMNAEQQQRDLTNRFRGREAAFGRRLKLDERVDRLNRDKINARKARASIDASDALTRQRNAKTEGGVSNKDLRTRTDKHFNTLVKNATNKTRNQFGTPAGLSNVELEGLRKDARRLAFRDLLPKEDKRRRLANEDFRNRLRASVPTGRGGNVGAVSSGRFNVGNLSPEIQTIFNDLPAREKGEKTVNTFAGNMTRFQMWTALKHRPNAEGALPNINDPELKADFEFVFAPAQ